MPTSAIPSEPPAAAAGNDVDQEMRRLRARLATAEGLADAIPHIVWTMNAAGAPTYFNAKWTEYTGLDLPATLRVGGASLVHPQDLQPFRDAMSKATEAVAAFEVSYRLRRAADGAYFWHVARLVPLTGAGAGVTSWVAVATNIDEQRAHEEEQRHLVEASRVLGTSLDLKQTLRDVATLLVPQMADWCTIDLVTEAGALDRQAVAHVDPSKVELAWDLWRRFPPRPEDLHGAYAVIGSGQPEILSTISDDLLVAVIPDPEILALIRSLGLRSSMCVPLVVRGRTIGAFTLVSSESARLYRDRDLAFANELAHRIAVAVDNARLYGAAEEARHAAEAMALDVVEQSRVVEQALTTMRAERDAAREQARAGGVRPPAT